MKMTVVTIALCTALASLCAVPVPVDVTAETLAKIKGNTACAVAYPTSGGCTACIPSGTINVTYILLDVWYVLYDYNYGQCICKM